MRSTENDNVGSVLLGGSRYGFVFLRIMMGGDAWMSYDSGSRKIMGDPKVAWVFSVTAATFSRNDTRWEII